MYKYGSGESNKVEKNNHDFFFVFGLNNLRLR